MKKRYYVLLVLLVVVGFSVFPEYWDKTHNYRENTDVVVWKHQFNDRCKNLNFKGFKEIKAQGSSFINFSDFRKNMGQDPDKIYVMNLLKDNVYYYKGRTLRWYGIKSTGGRAGRIMDERLDYKIRNFFRRLVYGYPKDISLEDRTVFQTEENILAEMGIHYYTPLDKHPNWLGDQSYIDNLIAFFKTIPSDGYLYIHCEHGRGRTTTFLALYDIFKNAQKVPLMDIINRHYCIGREDLFNTDAYKKGRWTVEALVARRQLIENFYEYMTSPTGYPHKTWAQWSQEKGIVKREIKIHR